MTESHTSLHNTVSPQSDITVNIISTTDLKYALRAGWQDFLAKPSHILFLGLIYPILGFVFARLTSDMNLVPLIYPLLTGFALVGPLAAIGLYELSKRREMGQELHWRHALNVTRSPAIGRILALGGIFLVLFFFWMIAAYVIYRWTIGAQNPETLSDLAQIAFQTREGWTLIILGNGIGFLFATFILTIGLVSFPMLLDRNCGLRIAMQTSYAAVANNFKVIMIWGFLIASGLAIGSLPLLIGLAIVLPVFGHASWHLYRRLVP